MSDVTDQDWPEGWEGLSDDQRVVYFDQLVRELGSDHPFLRHEVSPIGRAAEGYDVVYAVHEWEAPFAVVRLDWPSEDSDSWLARRQRPRRARWQPDITPLDRIADLARLH